MRNINLKLNGNIKILTLKFILYIDNIKTKAKFEIINTFIGF